MNIGQIGSISSSELIDAKIGEHQSCRSKHCPSCGHKLDRKPDWVGLPAGVKFDPTDQELIEHLEAKVKSGTTGELRSHPLIDEFILTIDGEDGICYTHPEKLPGVTRDGLSKHFFHRPSKAYTTGTRKRRKIQLAECGSVGSGGSGGGAGASGGGGAASSGETRWHKTGKTRPVMVNGRQKGCKKILVLYTNFGKHRKPEKTNWVMHQYHLGEHEEEKEGELVVSKIFYQTQPRQCGWSNADKAVAAAAAAAAAAAGGEQCVEQPLLASTTARDSVGSGSSSTSKEVVGLRDDLSSVAAGISGYSAAAAAAAAGAMDHMQHISAADHFSFGPFRKSFEEVGIGEAAAAAKARVAREERDQHHHPEHDGRHHHQAMSLHMAAAAAQEQHQQQQAVVAATAAFHVSRPTNPISGVLTTAALHQASIVLEDPYQRLLLQNDRLRQQEQVQHHQKLVGRPGSGLEELIMGCTSAGLRGVCLSHLWLSSFTLKRVLSFSQHLCACHAHTSYHCTYYFPAIRI